MIVTTELDTFQRKSFCVKAIRITEENYQEIIDWTGGHIDTSKKVTVIRIPCGSKRDNVPAYLGDWVTNLITYNDGTVLQEPNFRVYSNHTFLQAFQKIMGETEKYARVHELLMAIRTAQDTATYHSESSEGVMLLIEQTAREICAMV